MKRMLCMVAFSRQSVVVPATHATPTKRAKPAFVLEHALYRMQVKSLKQ
jgi:hypothetical protein